MNESANPTPSTQQAIRLSSPAFEPNGELPSRYTSEGQDLSPPLVFEGVPAGTKSLALLVEDPDAPDPKHPKRIWTHWVLFDLPPTATRLEEGARTLPEGARVGRNDWNEAKYGGPAPPIGRHRYFFKLYALDTKLGALQTPDRQALLKAMEGHVLSQAELVGTYERRSRR